MAKTPAIRILVVDDHHVVRSGLTASLGLEDDLQVVAEADSGNGVVDLVRRHHPDVVLMDLRLPGSDGIEITAALRTQAPGGVLSIADALMAPIPGVIVFELAKGLLAPGLAVCDEDLERAISFAARKLKLLVEPGGAATLAALLSGKLDAKGKAVALILSGGNAEFGTAAAAVARYPS